MATDFDGAQLLAALGVQDVGRVISATLYFEAMKRPRLIVTRVISGAEGEAVTREAHGYDLVARELDTHEAFTRGLPTPPPPRRIEKGL